MQRIIVISDIHGCLIELEDILHDINYSSKDRLILAGDLIDRGPDTLGVVQYAMELQCDVIAGNHEEKFIRYRRYQKLVSSGQINKNPMAKPQVTREKEWSSLGDKEFEWLSTLPFFIRFNSGNKDWIVVHGGLEIARPVEEQKPSQICRVQLLDENGNYISSRLNNGDDDTNYWAKRWDKPENVVYGHHVHSLKDPRIDRNPNGGSCYGIDTGCVFGGVMTALIIEGTAVSYVTVPAHKEWFAKTKYFNKNSVPDWK